MLERCLHTQGSCLLLRCGGASARHHAKPVAERASKQATGINRAILLKEKQNDFVSVCRLCPKHAGCHAQSTPAGLQHAAAHTPLHDTWASLSQ